MSTNTKLISVSAIALAMTGVPVAYAQGQAAAGQTPAETASLPEGATTDGDLVIDTVVVTGSSIRGVPPTGSNLIGVSREDIEMLGAATTPDLLATVPQLNSFSTAPQASLGGFGSFAPGMRSLPASATLPLMGSRKYSSVRTFVFTPA